MSLRKFLVPALAGAVGAVVALSVGASYFRMTSPVGFEFTYQGQLRNGNSLVNGAADLRFTLWDSATGGAQIGSVIERPASLVRDGRFATELNFGTDVFNGDARYVQTEVRSPAGVGQFLTLQPRQAITAVPYAMYALNSGDALWRRNVDATVVFTDNARVGIGTSTPTAPLQVVAPPGDDSVKLPENSIGSSELKESPVLVAPDRSFTGEIDYTITMPRDGVLVLDVEWVFCASSIRIDGVEVGGPSFSNSTGGSSDSTTRRWSGRMSRYLPAGPHRVQGNLRCFNNNAFLVDGSATVRAWMAGGQLAVNP